MGGKRYDADVKEKVSLLRSQGKSYAEIQKLFPIPKSTLSVWLGEKYAGIFDRKAQLEHLKKIRIISARSKRAAKMFRNTSALERGRLLAHDVDLKDPMVLRALLAMLYWAEGSKSDKTFGVRFVNTDPHLIALYMKLLRSSFVIDEQRLGARVHVHHYHKKKEVLAFWSKLTGIPESQFGKIYVKKRSNSGKRYRQNFMGICFIYYSGEEMRREIIGMGQEIGSIVCGNSNAKARKTQKI
ncbi:hypothetical protein C4568_04530 [Candidatus Parcubacteria bacterium]|nr:MAG: hypothetical protein C4568_04530 [Candidatus Parcubacteria bacterium]